jgi:hypothetical protein
VRLPVVESGTYYLFLWTDVYDAVVELDESNNVAVVPFTFNSTPADLAPIAFQAPSVVTARPNPIVRLVWGVTNQGVGPVEGDGFCHQGVYLSTNAVLDGTERFVGWWAQPDPIPPGGTSWETNTVQLPVTESGAYYLIFRTDAANSVVELDESNNVAVVPFTFNLTPPDLVPFIFLAPAVVTGWPNPGVTLIWGVTNQGVGAAEGRCCWSDHVYLSASATLNGTERLIESWSETGTVPPGGSYWRTNNLRVPVTDSGTYYLIFEANADNFLDEWNAFNNSLAVPVTFNLSDPPPPGTLEGGFLPDGSFVVDVYSESGTQYTLEASTDLLHWERVADFFCTAYPTPVLDQDAARFGRRFYRVTLLTQPAELRLDLAAGSGWETGDFELMLDGPLGHYYRLESSADLSDWRFVTQFQLVRSPMRFRDSFTTDAPVRFYRAVVQWR